MFWREYPPVALLSVYKFYSAKPSRDLKVFFDTNMSYINTSLES